MFKAVSKVLVIVVLLVSFIGQAMAFNTSMSCETSVVAHNTNHSELVSHYDSNPFEADSTEDCCGIECCDVDCTCITNACSPFAYFVTDTDPAKAVVLSEAVFFQQPKQPKSISTSLYRPPIFTS
jgi:hypothetical protein